MADEVVNSRLPKKELELLDRLVALGYYSNRSEAIRVLLTKGLQDFVEEQLDAGFLERLATPPLLTEDQLVEIGKMLFGPSVTKLVEEARER